MSKIQNRPNMQREYRVVQVTAALNKLHPVYGITNTQHTYAYHIWNIYD